MPQYDECENRITTNFHHVFTDNEDMLYSGLASRSMTDIKDDKATDL